ncbi:hypothetical protein KBC04_03800 [Candidatus Babeliales bacterium]|nr:hypothetical protein [Candidatus Babeliales bacterium]MBP9844192.1 hypothetical protein [Candidatus Babeliales bacterium]
MKRMLITIFLYALGLNNNLYSSKDEEQTVFLCKLRLNDDPYGSTNEITEGQNLIRQNRLMHLGLSYYQAKSATDKSMIYYDNIALQAAQNNELDTLEKQIQRHGHLAAPFLTAFQEQQAERVRKTYGIWDEGLKYRQARIAYLCGIKTKDEAEKFLQRNPRLLKKKKIKTPQKTDYETIEIVIQK